MTEATVTKTPAEQLIDAIGETNSQIATMAKGFDEMKAFINEAGKPQAPAVSKGERANTSRPFMISRFVKGIIARKDNHSNWNEGCKLEHDIALKLQKAYKAMGMDCSDCVIPLGTDLMPMDWNNVEDKKDLPGVPAELVKEIKDSTGSYQVDPDEIRWMQKNNVLGGTLTKAANNITTDSQGGYLRPLAAQGELIELWRNSLAFPRAGVSTVALPGSGRMRFPRQITATSVTGYAEQATISESNATFDDVDMALKAYSALSKCSEEFLKFISISGEALLRQDLVRQSEIAIDADCFDGPGGDRMTGLLSQAAMITNIASTVGTDGNTIGTSDVDFLVGAQENANAPVGDSNVAIFLRPKLWRGIRNRKDSFGRYVFDWAAANASGPASLMGYRLITSTNVPVNRAKGAASNLTLLMSIIPSEILMAMGGIMDLASTTSDGTDFAKRRIAIRCTSYVDINARHGEAVAILDDLIDG